ncbi:hypothetical protein RHMOL_Rhmol10G0198900 [Rhododendron molle]|uniref:Uncharacterized protein n=1 Tax=Rhododendron molle TaxID=49168 RepID=A0ACC0M5T4_RHOML|nr:hypothetical protein RHMOL_Rhmol10G0198900 [Rhododendron molle]
MDSSMPKDEKSWFHLRTTAELVDKINSSLCQDRGRNWILKLLGPQIMLTAQQRKAYKRLNESGWMHFPFPFAAISATRHRADVAYCIHALAQWHSCVGAGEAQWRIVT